MITTCSVRFEAEERTVLREAAVLACSSQLAGRLHNAAAGGETHDDILKKMVDDLRSLCERYQAEAVPGYWMALKAPLVANPQDFAEQMAALRQRHLAILEEAQGVLGLAHRDIIRRTPQAGRVPDAR